MNNDHIKEVLNKVLIALDFDDHFEDDIDTRHDAELIAFDAVNSLLAELEA